MSRMKDLVIDQQAVENDDFYDEGYARHHGEVPDNAIFDERGRFIRFDDNTHVFDLHIQPLLHKSQSPEEMMRHFEESLKAYDFIEDAWTRETSTTIRFTGEAENVDYVHDAYTWNWIADVNRPMCERMFAFTEGAESDQPREVVTEPYESEAQRERANSHEGNEALIEAWQAEKDKLEAEGAGDANEAAWERVNK